MLNGLDPIIIFNFYKKVTPADEEKFKGLSVAKSIISKFALPPIPVYLSERVSGLYIDSEEKNIEVATNVDTIGGGGAEFNQKGLTTTVKINMIASQETSIGLGILSAMFDLIFPKVSSQEYSIVYIHKSTIILNGLLHSFSIEQEANTTLTKVSLELVNKPLNLGVDFAKDPNAPTLNNIGSAPAGGAAGKSIGSGGSAFIPQASLPFGKL